MINSSAACTLTRALNKWREETQSDVSLPRGEQRDSVARRVEEVVKIHAGVNATSGRAVTPPTSATAAPTHPRL
jgi:hypothetical protein